MIDHVGFAVSNLERSRRFYEAALKPLGVEVLWEVPGEDGKIAALGLGSNGKSFFWLAGERPGGGSTHIAFAAESRALVDQFYQAAMAAGGKDNGAPGLREHYHPTYYGAFVLDPDGYNVEAVCHRAQ